MDYSKLSIGELYTVIAILAKDKRTYYGMLHNRQNQLKFAGQDIESDDICNDYLSWYMETETNYLNAKQALRDAY